MRLRFLAATMLALIAPFSAPAQQPGERSRGEVELRYWFTGPSGEARVGAGAVQGTLFDVEEDVGLEDKGLPEVRLILRPTERNKVRLEYFQADYEGDRTLDRTIQFEGQQYTVNTRVVSGFELKQLRVGYAYQFINIADRVRLGPVVELRGIWLDTRLAAPNENPPLRDESRFRVPVPTIGADLDIAPHDKVYIFATASGISIGERGRFFDMDVGVKIIPIRSLSFSAGYRLIDARVEDDDDFAKIRISGPFIGASFRF